MTTNSEFKAWRVEEQNGEYVGAEKSLSTADLPDGDVLIRVSHSSLNYKDALSASGNKGVTRSFPHTPGIDAAGEVVDSATGNPSNGSPVIVTGYDLGMNTDGGFGEYIRVPAAWCVPMPEGWNARTAMIYGTAGLTAGLCVQKLLTMGAKPEQGKVAVSGASGAVGTVAVELLAKLGFDVVAISGKADHADLLWSRSRSGPSDHRAAVYPARRESAGCRFGRDSPARERSGMEEIRRGVGVSEDRSVCPGYRSQ